MRDRLKYPDLLARVALSLLFLGALLSERCWAAGQTPNAIILVIDGARYSETFGDPSHRNIPHIWNDLRPQGTIYTQFYNHGQTATLGAHATMLNGNHSWVSFPPWDGAAPLHRPATPTLFEYFRAATGADATQAWVTTNAGMPPLEGMTYSLHPQYGPDYGASWVLGPSEDGDVVRQVEGIMDQYHPRLILVNLHGADRWAHAGNWRMYLNRIQNADALAYEVWEKIQSDPFYVDQTTLIVTNDHGRHGRDFTDHGDCCTGCQHIMFLALGPQIGQGVELSAPRRYLEDIGPTLGWLMDIPMPYVVDGEVMSELLSVPPAEVTGPYVPAEGLEVSIAVRDGSGLPRTVFQPGETMFFDTTVVSHVDSQVLLYQATARGGVCPDGEVAELGWYFGEPPTFLSPGDSWAQTYEARLRSYVPSGEWPISVQFRSVDATGALVHGTASVTITAE